MQMIPLGRVTYRRLDQSVTGVPPDTPKNTLQLIHLPGNEHGRQVVSLGWVLMVARIYLAVKWYHLGPNVGQTEPGCQVDSVSWVLMVARIYLAVKCFHKGPNVGQTEPGCQVDSVSWVLMVARF
jgi:hypothetical protein